MSTVPVKWRLWGLTFRVECGASGRWSAIGRAAGREPYPLDRLGSEATQDAMQHRLDHWGRTNHAVRVLPRAASQQQILAV